MLIEAGSKEYIFIPVTGPAGVDLTVFQVDVALIPDTQVTVGAGDWVAGSWLAPQAGAAKEAARLIDSTLFAAGEYMAFARVTASPEQVVKRSGRVRISDARP